MSPKPTRIKICGLRSTEAALVTANAGADYLGFNFVEGVRRQLQPDEGIQIIAEYRAGLSKSENTNRPGLVGLFLNQSPDFVNDISRKAGLDYLQLCGDEDVDYISKIEIPIFKMVRVKDGTTPADLDQIVAPLLSADTGVLLDVYDKKTPGGSGKSFDWSAAEGIANRENVLLAGGLNPENVQSAITQLSPWGVDVASGVETDGVKNPDRIRAFIQSVRSA
ncbi:MAG TPA: phosphoribosylanthranilate isomerase [Dehalococcoidia bacterium]|jgi:phosphoribosylanthranilate isomerase|nr:phosphoribosylanthranilate isomerase [Dehalococcoidia bacterium]HIK89869.1 phosphoribosylanthranilate isomerase [Dehalococcoidia bacterium]